MNTTAQIMKDIGIFFRQSHVDKAKYRQKETDFTRDRKLSFSNLTLILLSLFKSQYRQN